MIVNKPQFDTDNIKPGQVYWLKRNDRISKRINAPCIITGVRPLTIILEYFDVAKNSFEKTTFDIGSFINGNISLEKMEIKEKNNE